MEKKISPEWKEGLAPHRAAMIVEEIENGRRYRCSDTSGTDKNFPFDNIVFTVQKLKESEPSPSSSNETKDSN